MAKEYPPLFLEAADGTRTQIGCCESLIPHPRRAEASITVVPARDHFRLLLEATMDARKVRLVSPFRAADAENVITGYIASANRVGILPDGQTFYRVEMADAILSIRLIEQEVLV